MTLDTWLELPKQSAPLDLQTIDSLRSIGTLLSRRHVTESERQPARPAVDSTKQHPWTGHELLMADTVTHDGTEYSEEQLLHLVSEVKDFHLTHGSLLKVVQYETDSSVPARPVGSSVLPTIFQRRRFDEAIGLQASYNELYMRVAADPAWLHSVLAPVIESDTFIAALWDVYLKVQDAGSAQDIMCGVFRSDYMLNYAAGGVSLKQVEMNTFSCAGACHAERVAKMHRRLSLVREPGPQQASQAMQRLPTNNNTQSIVSLLKAAHDAYGGTSNEGRAKCVLMTVQHFNFNIADERPIEYGLWDAGVPCYRCEWQTALERTILTTDRTLLFKPTFGSGDLEVSVIYYRGGYAAAEYLEVSKETRVRLEMSRAVKCPDILQHLTTLKAVQQALTGLGALERFLPPEKANVLKQTFMPMQVLDASEAGLAARKLAIDPKEALNYVLKPNLEGGGHNIFRTDIPDFLNKRPQEQWHRYTLMRLIEPPPTTGTLMMPENLYHGAVVSELGILGTVLWKRPQSGQIEVLENEVAGWTFKTKPADIDEMSVVKGYGCFDCPLLTS